MSNVHYDGFISYRHNKRDTAVAIEIQHALEHLHIPSQIKEKYHKDRFERIFRDEEELNTGANLAEKIREALDNADFLIIICSEEYMKSKWCLLEVETFLKNHDPDHVLCVLSDGEPPAIFPEALLKYGEPLACDYRMDFSEARRTQLPKLASTMIGCTYDELVMRQEKYRRKRTLILTSIIGSLAAIAIAYLLYSNARITENYNATLINESKILAKESLDYYDQKDRYNAIEKALSALPSADFDRPVTDEAQFALSRATYAYQVNRTCIETGRIDDFNDISEYFTSFEAEYLVYLDATKTIHTYDLQKDEEISKFSVDAADITNIHEGKAGQLVFCDNDKVYAYDYLDGTLKWQAPLSSQNSSISHLSNNYQLIGVSDGDAVQILSIDGQPYQKLSLPEKESDFIRDFVWSKDDTKIAINIIESVITSMSSVSYIYKAGIFDLESGDVHIFDESLNNVLYMDFVEDGTLFVLEDRRTDYSTLIRNVETNIVSNYVLHAYKDDTELYELPLDSNSMFDEIAVLSRGEDAVLVFGNDVYLIDPEGKLLNTYNVTGVISKFLYGNDDNIHLACNNGYVGDLYFEDGHSILIKNFPEAYDDILYFDSGNSVGLGFLVLKDGNIQFYENVYDDSLSYFKELAFYYSPQEKIINDDLMMFKADNLIGFADLERKVIISAFPMAEDAYYHLLDLYENKGYVLMCQSGKVSSILIIDGEDGTLLEKRDLSTRDFFESQGYLSYPLSMNEAIYMDKYYTYPSAVSVYDHILYYHDVNSLNTIRIHDLQSGEERSVYIDLSDLLLVNNNGYFYPSELLVFDEGNKIYAIVHDFSAADPLSIRYGVWIDLNDSSFHLLENVPCDGFYAYGKDDILVYADDNNLNIIDTVKEDNMVMPCSQKAISFFYHEGRLYLVNPDNSLEIYEEGKLIRRVALEGNDISMCPNKLVRFEVRNKELFIYIDMLLYIVNLDSDSGRTLYDFMDNALGVHNDDLIVYGYNGNKSDFRFYLGEYKRYSLEELIDRADKQLKEFN